MYLTTLHMQNVYLMVHANCYSYYNKAGTENIVLSLQQYTVLLTSLAKHFTSLSLLIHTFLFFLYFLYSFILHT